MHTLGIQALRRVLVRYVINLPLMACFSCPVTECSLDLISYSHKAEKSPCIASKKGYEFFLSLPPLLGFRLKQESMLLISLISSPTLLISADFLTDPWHTVSEISSGIIQSCLLPLPWILLICVQQDSPFVS